MAFTIIILFGALCFFILMLPKRPKRTKTVVDKVAQDTINMYNNYYERIQDISNLFVNNLNVLQRNIILNQDGYSHQKCVYLVDEFNSTSELLASKLKEAANCINEKQYQHAKVRLQYLDGDIDYLKGLLKTLGEIKIEPHSFDSVFNVSTDTEEEKPATVSYFSDCNNRDELVTRYKALVKVFHPDSKAGNDKIFKAIKDEYDERIILFPKE